MSPLSAALDYAAAAGFFVFPLLPRSKEPACRRGLHDATGNPATIRRFWSVSDRNIAIRTGVISGIWVLDIDGEAGAEGLAILEARHGALPATRTVLTANGKHFYFRAIQPIQCSVGRVAKGIDVRGEGGMSSRRRAFTRAAISTSGSSMTYRPRRTG